MGAILMLLGPIFEGCDSIGVYLMVLLGNMWLFFEGCVDIRVMRAVLLVEVTVDLWGTSD
jgi:hypothetical protein